MLALVHGRPEQLSLLQILKAFIDFREEVIVHRTRFDLKRHEKSPYITRFCNFCSKY